MVSRKLMGVWAAVDFLLLVAGALSVALSIIWRAPDVLRNMILDSTDLTAGMVVGIMLLATFVISLGAIVQRNHVTIGLVMLNWVLVLDSLAILIVGTKMWYFSLQERANFHGRFAALSPDKRITIQDQFKCCGYFNSTDLAEVGGSFCTSKDFIEITNNATSNFCVGPITSAADVTLNNVFTTIYGFMAITLCLMLASICVINKRKEDERFRRIDAKRGGKGFV